MTTVNLKDDRSEIIHYSFKNYPIYISRALLSSYSNYEAAPHWHEDIEFIYVYSGHMDYNISGQIVSLEPNQGIFVNSGQLHYGFSKKHNESDFACFLLHPSMLSLSTAYEQEYLLPLLKNESISYILLTASSDWQKKILSLLTQIVLCKDHPAAPMKILSMFMQIWSLLFENVKAKKADQKSADKDLSSLKDMIGYIQKNYQQQLSLKEIAKAGLVGISKCNQLFNKYLQTTPMNYIASYRLDKSCWYLRNTDKSISEIAELAGFASSSYYAETFRKYYNTTPSSYRKS